MIPIITIPVRLRPTVTRWTRPSGEITWESRTGAPADRAQPATASRDISAENPTDTPLPATDALVTTIAALSIEDRPSRSMFVFPAAAPDVYGGIDDRFEYVCPKPLVDLEVIMSTVYLFIYDNHPFLRHYYFGHYYNKTLI